MTKLLTNKNQLQRTALQLAVILNLVLLSLMLTKPTSALWLTLLLVSTAVIAALLLLSFSSPLSSAKALEKDISASLTAAQMLDVIRNAEARFKAISQSMPFALLMLDGNGQVQFVNQSTEDMFGCGSETLSGKELSSLLPSTTNVSDFLNKLLQGSSPAPLDAVKANGESFPVEVTARSFNIDSSSRILLAILDVSEKRKVERLKQQLMSMVSHDISSPLTSIQLCLDFIANSNCGELNEKGKKYAQRARRNVTNLTRLVNDLLTVDRLDSGKLKLYVAEHDAQSLVQSCYEMVQEQCDAKRINVRQVIEAQRINVDAERLKQVLVNLLSNAIKFSPQESQIDISAKLLDKELELRVTDQGRGVPETDRKGFLSALSR